MRWRLPRGFEVGGGDDGNDAGRGCRCLRINRFDSRMRQRSAVNREVFLLWQIDVSGVTAGTGYKAQIFFTSYRFTYAMEVFHD